MIGFCPLASGSKGNALYCGTKNTKILIDAGISAKNIKERLDEIGVSIHTIDAICITHEHHDHIKISGLLIGSKDVVVRQTKKMLEEGYHLFKLKVSDNIDEEIAKVRAVNEIIGGQALLHLDANQSWDLAKAIHFGNEVGLAAVEYIEEPFKYTSLIHDFFMQTTIPVALDESLQAMSFNDIKGIDGVDFFILKPTMLGGIEKINRIVNDANRFAITTVLSSSYESGIGMLTLANLAGMTTRDRAAGLDTLKYFKGDLLKEPLSIHRGRMDIGDRMILSKDIRFDHLTKT